MKYRALILQAEGGSDKDLDGNRKDTLPIKKALEVKNVSVKVLFFRDEWSEKIIDYVKKNKINAVIVRINPGNLPNGESKLFYTLKILEDINVVVLNSPKIMKNFGAKDALTKLIDTKIVPNDTFAYYSIAEFRNNFPNSLKKGTRVLKQNRGSTGKGIWRVELIDKNNNNKINLNTKLKCTEAFDNHVEFHDLETFMNLCEQYIIGDNGMILDMRFLPRIKEGELRILIVADEPIFVVHKKPAETENAFSATINSGARYEYHAIEDYPKLMDIFLEELPKIRKKLGGFKYYPTIWTADFMLDTNKKNEDIYILGEMNCSCVGFFTHLNNGIQEKMATEIIKRIEDKIFKLKK